MEPPEGGGKRRRHGAAAPAEMGSVDDLLREILVRLPDTASLARAALACKPWRRVASHPCFLRRFHSLHRPPPLLGFIMSEPPPKVFYPTGADTLVVRARAPRNPHLTAAAARADWYLEDFTARNPRTGYEWILRSCDGGLLLLTYGFIEREEVAVYDPIARTAVFLRRPDITGRIRLDSLQYALVARDDGTFRVFGVKVSYDVMGVVFDSRTGEWAALPTLENAVHLPWSWKTFGGLRAGRFAYWQSNMRLSTSYCDEPERALVLDTVTMEWTLIQVPFPRKESYCVADMAEHGGLCLVASKDQTVQLWARDDNGWVIKKSVSLIKQFVSLKNLRREWMKRVRILAVRDGYIYMEFWSLLKPNSYLLVLNWDTMDLSVHPNPATEKYRGPAFPFFMTWAPPLLSPAQMQAFDRQGLQQGEDKVGHGICEDAEGETSIWSFKSGQKLTDPTAATTTIFTNAM
ncbi:hypothetical protein U9M48_026304 [Paspalum notatum var. saurae]|uniref:F-box domain-containing protein n=1 Tax=Paspalum notatum var. saurae TaxID=547442 RepID=A0AAQ3TV05_PASNO